jgi:hypothetical protein
VVRIDAFAADELVDHFALGHFDIRSGTAKPALPTSKPPAPPMRISPANR